MTQIPIASQPMRYQQLFQAAEMKQDIKTPVRFQGVRFRAKQNGDPGKTVDIQLKIGTFQGFGSNNFDSNLLDAKLVYRGVINLPTSTAGQWVVNLPFNQDFTWDNESNIVLDIAVFANGNNNQPFLYFFDSFSFDLLVGVDAQWAIGPTATDATQRQRGTGMVTRFDYKDGVVLNYGQGCRGQAGYVPVISANGVPVVGNTAFRVNLTVARPQTPCLLLWGGSRTTWGTFPLPLDLQPFGIPGCSLLAEPVMIFSAMTLGGSPGSGNASVPFGIPASTLLKGIELFAQWAVVDDAVPERVVPLAFSDGLRMVIG
jgi:hypothetical protein